MDKNKQTTWWEALKITGIILAWIIGFWLFFFGVVNIVQHIYEIKMFFGLGGQIL